MQESIVFLYADGGDAWLHEDAPLQASWLNDSARDAGPVRSAMDWVGLGGLRRDADFFERVFVDTGVDLRSAPIFAEPITVTRHKNVRLKLS